jgi:threonyl-tRNA synthetase
MVQMINVTLRGGVVKEYNAGITPNEIAKSLGAGLYKAACTAKIDDVLCDLRTPLEKDCELQILTFDDPEGKKTYWHTASHILAQAVKRLYPQTKLTIGPAIDNGFYYDFDSEVTFNAEVLEKIEEQMKFIVKENLEITRFTLKPDEAIKLMQDKNEPYKVELIGEHAAKGEDISFYTQGEFTELCAGPHIHDTGRIKALKLTQCTGAYWRADAKNKMLQRIYGIAFPKAAQLEEYLAAIEDAKKRDHNKIGRELEYFTTVDYIGQGLPIMMPKGARVLQILQRFVEDEEERRGYLLTKTPMMAKSDLYKISGHWDHYREGMFILGNEEKDKEVFALRPMTCPFQFQVYLAKPRSYRDLPMRLNETSTLFRNEDSGEMHGLIRVRQFTISEGHIACTPQQLEEEFRGCVDLTNFMLTAVGLIDDVTYRFSKWDPNNTAKYIGTPEQWEEVQSRMEQILDDIGIKYTVEIGEAAFYGPKLDVQIRNVHGKEDTLTTVQIDFLLAERFGMEYVDADGSKKYPYVLHRTSMGCYERTLALLLEKYAGAMPTWLAPVQVKVLPISEKQEEYATMVWKRLQAAGIRADLDIRSEKVGYRIREAQLEKVPYMLITGDKEIEANTVAVRARKDGDKGSLSLDDFISVILDEIHKRII